MDKVFAAEYGINDQGWIKFPDDKSYRKSLFPAEHNQHPAKANIYLVQSIVEYVSDPGDTLLDVMAGVGTLLVGALVGRNVICLEISNKFHMIQVAAVAKLETIAPGISTAVSLFNVPCQTILPIPNIADHIVFSPQYAGIMKAKGTDSWNKDHAWDFEEYSAQPMNLGTMSEFLWTMEMAKVYSKCYDSLKSGGTMTLILKDHISAGQRIELTNKAIISCLEIGFTYDPSEHFKWAAPGMPYTVARRARGEATVEDEDIVVLRKGDA